MTRCFVCACEIERDHDHDPDDLVTVGSTYNALVFRATGNFGSTLFDPIEVHEFLEICICDTCVKSRIDHVAWIHNIETSTRAKSLPFSDRKE
jgi:hypothetical protein